MCFIFNSVVEHSIVHYKVEFFLNGVFLES